MFRVTTPDRTINNRNQSAFLEVSESIPESFLAGWADYEAGLLVDMHRVPGNQPPLV